MTLSEIHTLLGIPSNYGEAPWRPKYAEASCLVDAGLDVLGRSQRLSVETATAWTRMQAAARSDGIDILLVSGFRSIQYQCALLQGKLAAGGDLDAILTSHAAPGFSQHHTGCAVDLSAAGCPQLDEAFENTVAFQWLVCRATEFGFFMSYPRNNRYGFIYEPWHWAHETIDDLCT